MSKRRHSPCRVCGTPTRRTVLLAGGRMVLCSRCPVPSAEALLVAAVTGEPLRDAYARLAAEYDQVPPVDDCTGGLPGVDDGPEYIEAEPEVHDGVEDYPDGTSVMSDIEHELIPAHRTRPAALLFPAMPPVVRAASRPRRTLRQRWDRFVGACRLTWDLYRDQEFRTSGRVPRYGVAA